MPEEEISEYDYSDWFYQSSERTFSTEISASGPTISREAQLNRTNDLSLEFIGTVGMALVEITGLTDFEMGAIIPVLMYRIPSELRS